VLLADYSFKKKIHTEVVGSFISSIVWRNTLFNYSKDLYY